MGKVNKRLEVLRIDFKHIEDDAMVLQQAYEKLKLIYETKLGDIAKQQGKYDALKKEVETIKQVEVTCIRYLDHHVLGRY